VTALAFELTTGPPLRVAGVVRTRIERVPESPYPHALIDEYKQLGREGWSVTCLLCRETRTLVLLASIEGGP
jgi:hypothetical protein